MQFGYGVGGSTTIASRRRWLAVLLAFFIGAAMVAMLAGQARADEEFPPYTTDCETGTFVSGEFGGSGPPPGVSRPYPDFDSTPVVSVPAIAGASYEITVSGMYFANDGIYADAQYSNRNFVGWQDTLSPPYDTYGPDLLELAVDGSFVDWGPFSSDHTYTIEYTATGSTIDFQIWDIYSYNNSGGLCVDVAPITCDPNIGECTENDGNGNTATLNCVEGECPDVIFQGGELDGYKAAFDVFPTKEGGPSFTYELIVTMATRELSTPPGNATVFDAEIGEFLEKCTQTASEECIVQIKRVQGGLTQYTIRFVLDPRFKFG